MQNLNGIGNTAFVLQVEIFMEFYDSLNGRFRLSEYEKYKLVQKILPTLLSSGLMV